MKFIELTQIDTGQKIWVNLDRVTDMCMSDEDGVTGTSICFDGVNEIVVQETVGHILQGHV